MSVTVRYTFDCGGCRATAKAEGQVVEREFVSVSGRSYGLGSYRLMIPGPNPPEGWIAFDPFTGCCYCPVCSKEIINSEEG